MNRRNGCFTVPRSGLNGVPAEAFALLFGYFLEDSEGLWAAILAAGGEDGVDEGDGSGVGRAEGSGFDAGEENFVAFTGEGRNVGVRDAHTVSIARVGQMHTFDSLAEAAAEADRQN